MKTVKTLAIVLSIALFSLTYAEAQTKRQLREENAQLKDQNARLTQEVDQLEQTNDRLMQENQSFVQQNRTLRDQVIEIQRENTTLTTDLQQAESEAEKLQARLDALATSPSTGGTTGGGGIIGGNTPDPNDTRKCAYYQNRLKANTTYTELYNELHSEGWGIQVFSSGSLCQAAEKAEEFKKSYKLYNTYLRCKEVNGRYVYAVIYGSLKDHGQAKTYLANFKRVALSQWGGSAFLVQH